MKISKEEINKLKIPINYVLVEFDIIHNETIKFNETTFFVNTSYDPDKHVVRWGTVVKAPENLLFDRDNAPKSMEWKTIVEVKPGDKVLVDYYAVLMAFGNKANPALEFEEPLWFESEGRYYCFIKYSDIFLRGDYPLNGYTLIKMEDFKEVESTIKLFKKKNQDVGTVVACGRPNDEYILEEAEPATDGKFDFDVGDKIVFHRHRQRQIEHEYHSKMEEFYVVHGKDIMATL